MIYAKTNEADVFNDWWYFKELFPPSEFKTISARQQSGSVSFSPSITNINARQIISNQLSVVQNLFLFLEDEKIFAVGKHRDFLC